MPKGKRIRKPGNDMPTKKYFTKGNVPLTLSEVQRAIKKKTASPSMPADGASMTAEQFEEWVVKTATYFSVAYRVGPGNNHQEHYSKLRDAIQARNAYNAKPAQERHSRLAMVYAVNAAGRRAMIAEKQEAKMLAIRGEK